jgi:uncharacterized lipoprotein YmbA
MRKLFQVYINMQRYCPCACTSLAEYADHQQQVYDTQGLIVNKSLHQQFADEFQRALTKGFVEKVQNNTKRYLKKNFVYITYKCIP